MSTKVYWDPVSGKEVYDHSGVKDEAAVKAEHGLDVSTQVLEIDDAAGESHYLVGGTLTKKTKAEKDAEKAADKAAKDAEKEAKDSEAQAVLGLNDADWAVVKASLG